jgi:hypothetical protein
VAQPVYPEIGTLGLAGCRFLFDGTPKKRSSRRGEEVGDTCRRAIRTVVRGLPIFGTRCSEAGPTAACLKLSGCFRVVTMSYGCASRAPGIRLIKAPESRVYTESPSRNTNLPNYGTLHCRACQGSAYTYKHRTGSGYLNGPCRI